MMRIVSAAVVLASAAVVGCGADRRPQDLDVVVPPNYVMAIHDVFSIDGELGVVRNRRPENVPLAQAVREYVAAIDSLDFSGCPEDFVEAFRWHRNAWAATIPFFERYPDVRGEMHELFEEIRSAGGESQAELERLEGEIWRSWTEVEAVAADYGAIDAPRAE